MSLLVKSGPIFGRGADSRRRRVNVENMNIFRDNISESIFLLPRLCTIAPILEHAHITSWNSLIFSTSSSIQSRAPKESDNGSKLDTNITELSQMMTTEIAFLASWNLYISSVFQPLCQNLDRPPLEVVDVIPSQQNRRALHIQRVLLDSPPLLTKNPSISRVKMSEKLSIYYDRTLTGWRPPRKYPVSEQW